MCRLSVGWALTLALMVTLLAAPVHAQKRNSAPPPSPEELDKKRDAEALDQQYKSALKRMNPAAAPARTDPWQNMRGSDNNAKR